jgi:hypothetical protein
MAAVEEQLPTRKQVSGVTVPESRTYRTRKYVTCTACHDSNFNAEKGRRCKCSTNEDEVLKDVEIMKAGSGKREEA